MRPEKNTTQICIRLENDMLEDLEYYSKQVGVDKTNIIKQAVILYLGNIEDTMINEAIKDFVNLRIDDKRLKEVTEWKEIPSDLKKTRETNLDKISKENYKK